MASCRHLAAVVLVVVGLGPGCRGDRPPPGPVAPTPGPPAGPLADGDAPAGLPGDAVPSEPDARGTNEVSETVVGEVLPDVVAGLPDAPFALPVDGHEPAVAVPPVESIPMPAPLIVILHGNFDRPEWQCTTWSSVGTTHGWLLCPRGTPRSDTDPALDRWTWEGPEAAARETAAAVAGLRAAWPGRVRDDGAVLVGFSLGARYAPEVAAAAGGPRFAALVLVEQGFAVSAADARAAVEAGVGRVVYVCGERTECRMRAEAARPRWQRAGAEVELLMMEGVGHGYPEQFDPLAERVFESLSALPVGAE